MSRTRPAEIPSNPRPCPRPLPPFLLHKSNHEKNFLSSSGEIRPSWGATQISPCPFPFPLPTSPLFPSGSLNLNQRIWSEVRKARGRATVSARVTLNMIQVELQGEHSQQPKDPQEYAVKETANMGEGRRN